MRQKQLWRKGKKISIILDTLDNRKENNDEGFVNFNENILKLENAKL